MPQHTFEIKFATRHVEFKLSREESLDSLCREGFRETYETRWLTCLLERWDHPDGRYKLVAYKGGGLYMCEDVNDPQWKEIIDLISCEDKPPIPLVSEDWFELEMVSDHALPMWVEPVSDECPLTRSLQLLLIGRSSCGGMSLKAEKPRSLYGTVGRVKQFSRIRSGKTRTDL